jgi:hypothetical protein
MRSATAASRSLFPNNRSYNAAASGRMGVGEIVPRGRVLPMTAP